MNEETKKSLSLLAQRQAQKKKISYSDYTAKSAKCQAFLDEAIKQMLAVYENMSETEQRAFDLGEAFRSMLSARNATEEENDG